MENFKVLRDQVQQKREAFTLAEQAYYDALQAWSLGQQGTSPAAGPVPTPEEVEQKRSESRQARQLLQAEIALLYAEATPQQLIEQVPAALPFLLLPLRVEARYLTIRHVVRHLNPADALEASTNNRLGNRFRNLGFETDDEGVMTYQVQALHLVGGGGGFFGGHQRFEDLKPPSGNFIRRKNDDRELRLRFYPDEVFMEGLERALQREEWQAGVHYWQQVGAGQDHRQAWQQLAAAATPARGAWIVRATQPTNFVEGQPPPANPAFPDGKPLKDGAYTYPPVTRLLPERLVVRLYKNGTFQEFTGKVIPEPLVLGLDPTHDPFDLDPGSGIQQAGSGLQTPEYLRWIHHFEAAEAAGLALRINLDQHPDFKAGVDKIVVVGAKLSADESVGARLWGQQLENHLYKEEGLSLVPKGTATNNFEQQKAGFNRREQEADLYFQSEWLPPAPALLETDESRLKRALGLDGGFRLPLGHCPDISEGSLLNQLLWPATWGYYLLQFFTPGLTEATREQVRRFFFRHVHGRGALPVLRVNRQPYGIIPVSSFAHWQYGAQELPEEEQVAARLWSLFLSKGFVQWQVMAGNVKTVTTVGGRGLDDRFMEMLGVSPAAASLEKNWVAGTGFQEVMRAAQADASADTGLGADTAFQPAVFERTLVQLGLPAGLFGSLTRAYNAARQPVRRILLDGLPISEERPLERLAGKTWNYLEWLAQARLTDIWNHDFSGAPAGDGATDSSAAVSAFAVLMRQAVLRAYLEAGMQVAEPDPGLWLLRVKDFEAQQLHLEALSVNPAALSPDNKLHQAYSPIITQYGLTQPFELETDRRLYFSKTYPATQGLPLADWLEGARQNTAVPLLQEVWAGLTYFSQAPTGRLERLFSEHLDLCSHRLDAWVGGLVSQRLEKQRQAQPQGLYLGAFGYLLGLQPNTAGSIVIVEEEPEYLPADPQQVELAAIPVVHAAAARQHGIDPAGPGWDRAFFYIGNNPAPRVQLNTITGQVQPDKLINIAQSDGFIHAPSTAHATAAAILRAGFLNHQADNQTALLAIQLNSPRVRQALQLLEGMQQGAAVGELLGYYFERLLHENNLDAFLYNLRAAFPIQRTTAEAESPSPLTSVDGLELLKKRRQNPADPTGWLNGVPGIPPSDIVTRQKINAQALALEDYADALADLLLAESVYQTAKGNKDRAAAALRIMNSGGQVVVPEFVRTPGKGSTVTHRVGVVFKPAGAGWTPGGSPRAALAPGLNAWLQQQLPPPEQVAIALTLPDGRPEKITLAELAIEPIDLLHALPESLAGVEASAFGLYVLLGARQKFGPGGPADQPDIRADFKDRSNLVAAEISVLEISSLVAALRKMVQDCRPLSANDFLLPDSVAAGATHTDASQMKTALTAHILANTPAGALLQDLRSQSAALEAALAQNQAEAPWQALARALLPALLAAWQQGMNISGVEAFSPATPLAAGRLAAKAAEVASQLENGLAQAGQVLHALPATTEGEALLKNLQEAAGILFGTSLRLFPDVRLGNTAAVKTAYQGRQWIQQATEAAIDGWMGEAALVRRHLRVYRQALLLGETLSPAKAAPAFSVLQFPFFDGRQQPWIGGLVPEETSAEERASLSLLLDLPAAFDPEAGFPGLVVDEWPEWIPERTVDTGVAFQYNQPNTEPPQTMLLAVAPVEGGNWNWEHLVGAVNDALELSKMRLVTPAHISETTPALNQLLPAILLPFMENNRHTPVVEGL